MERPITSFRTDAAGDWVALLSCGHQQHVRHRPPFTLRPWVTTEEGRRSRIGVPLDCVRCDAFELPAGFAPYVVLEGRASVSNRSHQASTVGWIALGLLLLSAVAPLGGRADAWIDGVLDAWRTCDGLVLAAWLSELVMPVGVAVLCLAVVRSLWRGRPGIVEVASVLAALAAGVLLVGALKDVLDRPRPGAEFLGAGGGSFPSGHVANTVLNGCAILTLWWGGRRGSTRWRGWVVLGAILAIIALARVYERRHWASDVLGAVAVAGAYGLLAIRHPAARWRVAATVTGLVLVVAGELAAGAGFKIAFPAGTPAGRSAPVEHVAFAAAYGRGWLRGDWALDEPDPRRLSAWLRSDTGEVVLPAPGGRVEEVRLVTRPRHDPDVCLRLRVALNGDVLGESILQLGWRAYVYPVRRQDEIRDGPDVLTLDVLGAPESVGPGARRAAFSELSLHARRAAPE